MLCSGTRVSGLAARVFVQQTPKIAEAWLDPVISCAAGTTASCKSNVSRGTDAVLNPELGWRSTGAQRLRSGIKPSYDNNSDVRASCLVVMRLDQDAGGSRCCSWLSCFRNSARLDSVSAMASAKQQPKHNSVCIESSQPPSAGHTSLLLLLPAFAARPAAFGPATASEDTTPIACSTRLVPLFRLNPADHLDYRLL